MEIRNIGPSRPTMLSDDFDPDIEIKNKNDFNSFLSNALNKVNEQQLISDEYKKLLATGDVDNLHDVTIAQEKANISLQLTLSIRNKIVEAYKEIMRMQI